MKIRTDFVTNSSSSSFVTINITDRKGNTYELDYETDSYLNEDCIPELSGNVLRYSAYKKTYIVSTVSDLMACVYFAQCAENLPFEVCSSVFAFLTGTVSPCELKSKLEKLIGFEQLEELDSDDYEDAEEMREAVMELLPECLEEYGCDIDITDEEALEPYKDIIESIDTLADFDSLEFNSSENSFGEFINGYTEALNDILLEEEFTAVSVDDPSYKQQFESWLEVLKEEILYDCEPATESYEELVENALASGDPYDMIPSCVMTSNSMILEIPNDVVCGAISEEEIKKSAFKCDDIEDITIEGKIFVLTGHSSDEDEKITKFIEDHGGEVKSSVVLKTDYLIVNNNYTRPATTKYKKALELRNKGKDITIIDSKKLFDLCQK